MTIERSPSEPSLLSSTFGVSDALRSKVSNENLLPAATEGERLPPIFGQSHKLLAEVASKAAFDADAAHVRAGRLPPSPAPSVHGNDKPSSPGADLLP
ncbi:MAG TPA: hypothetical protein VFR90_06815 [Methylibium sp.]|uniref:hypothetical protein n=1 Tax=Methylibium sp. TaxID=2067992 RepID=UPI002DBD7E40|nr:hypothetical protein [Methylibium sp.]HEU4458817.1 hypothetical protein [Methylibium sp.]